ncbi:MAG: ABC transporter ATP-binding protein [Candidatus Neomarinimicrobiota bacterium]
MVLRTVNLSKRFGNRWAVADLNLAVESGQIFGFLGPNGAGKSTTIRMLLALIKPSRGTYEFFGQDARQLGIGVYRKIGALVEKPDFYLYLSAERNLKMLGELSGGVSSQRIDEVLEIVKLQDRASDKVKNYSHGMRQRLGIAQAILCDPELIILDEPTTGLDPVGIKEIRDLIVSLAHDFGKTIFLSSHLLHEVEQVCSHMAIIDNGKLVVQGAVHDLLKATDYFVTEIAVDDPERARTVLADEPRIRQITLTENTLKVQAAVEARPDLVERLVQNGLKVSAVIPRTSLEDYYLSLVQHSDGQ